jgi:plasmid stabilization system protein ParE
MRVLIGQRAEEDLAQIFACLPARADSSVAERFRIEAESALGGWESASLR